MAKADVVLAIGSSLTTRHFGPCVPPARPSSIPPTMPATSTRSTAPITRIVGDAALVLDALIAEVGRQNGRRGGNALTSLKEEIAHGQEGVARRMGEALRIPTRRRSTSTA